MELTTVTIDKPETINFILGQSHFIKSVEDLHEALVNAVPGIKFGLAFCGASGACLVRLSRNDEAIVALAWERAGGQRQGTLLSFFSQQSLSGSTC